MNERDDGRIEEKGKGEKNSKIEYSSPGEFYFTKYPDRI